jgi:hypothetical protein
MYYTKEKSDLWHSDLMSLNNNKLIDMMRLFNFKNVIEKPTRVTNHSRTLLDPIIVSDTINYVFSGVLRLPDNISDHDAFSFAILFMLFTLFLCFLYSLISLSL